MDGTLHNTQQNIQAITVFCGSSSGNNICFTRAAEDLGMILAKHEIALIYGGAQVGLMGSVANAVLNAGGKVIGVLPKFLGSKEIAHPNLTQLFMVESMHERKAKMDELAQGVIALPGGFGTLEEFFEMLTWAQLGLHKKPIGLLNVNGFYDPLLEMVGKMHDLGFITEVHRDMVLVANTAHELLEKMKNYQAPEVPKWIKEDQI